MAKVWTKANQELPCKLTNITPNSYFLSDMHEIFSGYQIYQIVVWLCDLTLGS